MEDSVTQTTRSSSTGFVALLPIIASFYLVAGVEWRSGSGGNYAHQAVTPWGSPAVKDKPV